MNIEQVIVIINILEVIFPSNDSELSFLIPHGVDESNAKNKRVEMLLVILRSQIHLVDVERKSESVNEMHCQPHHVVRTTVGHPLVVDQLLDHLGVKDVQLLCVLKDFHYVHFTVVMNLIVLLPVNMLIHDEEASGTQKVDGVIDRLDLRNILIFNKVAIHLLRFSFVKCFLRKNLLELVSQQEKRAVIWLDRLCVIRVSRWPLVKVKLNVKNFWVKKVGHFDSFAQYHSHILLKNEAWDKIILEFNNVVNTVVNCLNLIIFESVVDSIGVVEKHCFVFFRNFVFEDDWIFLVEPLAIIFVQ